MFYKILDLPEIPECLVDIARKKAKQYFNDNEIINKYILSAHGRELYRNGKFIGHSSALGRKKINDDIEQWIMHNITEKFNDVAITVSQDGMSYSGPHIDQSRNFALLYILDQGGDKVLTRFWKTKESEKTFKNYYNSYDNLELIGEVIFPVNKWCLMDAKTIHSVENLERSRVSVQVSLMENFWNDTE